MWAWKKGSGKLKKKKDWGITYKQRGKGGGQSKNFLSLWGLTVEDLGEGLLRDKHQRII